jgi:hypothetical protein
LDPTPDASGLELREEIAEANFEPFCSSWTRLLFGVEELKNAVQLALICAIADAEPPLAAALALVAGADEAGVLTGAEDEEELELLEQADIAVTSTRPRAGARYPRRAATLNRIVTRPFGSAAVITWLRDR